MTFEEAKKILKSEGFEPERFLGVLVEDVKAASWEKIEVSEAMKVVAENGYFPFMKKSKYEERKARLEKEYEKNTKAPGSAENSIKGDLSGNKSIEHCSEPIPGSPLSAVEGIKLKRKDNQNTSENPALKESATQFNDALLDEQAKKIAELTKENERLERVSKTTTDEFNKLYYRMITKSDKIEALGKEIARLNKIIHKKNFKIEELRKESSRHLEGKMKMFGENFDLEQELKDKNAVLSDVAEELRLSKIREKNLTEVCQKYVKEVEDLREQLANKVVDKIDAQALKSAESALAYKEKVIAEKNEVIGNLRKELDESNKHQQQAYRSCADKNKEIRALKLQISALEKRGNGIDWKRNADAIKLYVNRASHERLWNLISQDICNEQELSFIVNHGGERVKYALRFDGTDIVYECSDPDKKPSFFRDDSVGAVTNQKDCSPVKDTHPTEDNPEEIEIEKAVKLVRKAMKEGHTVTIDYKD